MRNKKGDEKYYLIISLILGLIVLSLAMYFLFQEYFTQDDIDWEVCRESVILRSGNMGGGVSGQVAKKLQENFPFKCKTQVVEIGSEYDENESLAQIADIIAQCYYTYGEGKTQLYPDQIDNWLIGSTTSCFVCARIHFSDDFKKEHTILNSGEYLVNTKMGNSNTETYFEYLYENNKKLSLIDKTKFQNLLTENQKFNTADGDIFVVYYYSPGGVVPDVPPIWFNLSFDSGSIKNKIDSITTFTNDHEIHLFYYQEKQIPNMFFDTAGKDKICGVIETIPA